MTDFVHDPIVRSINMALEDIFNGGRLADKAIEHYLRSEKKFGSRDRKLFAETCYGIVRWFRRIYEASGGTWTDDLLSSDGGFNLQFEPEDLRQWLANWLHFNRKIFRGESLPTPDPEFQARWEALTETASKESVSNWFYERGKEELQSTFDSYLSDLNREAPVFLRTNTLLGSSDQLFEKLVGEGFDVEKIDHTTLQLKTRAQIFKSKSFNDGLFEMQDLHSQKVAPFLLCEPGHRVVDACAGAGGKTLHLAAIMKNKGQLLALDIHDKKLLDLKRRARRAKTSIVESRHINTTKVLKRLESSADRLLLDVPCSGSGVLRRNPDAKWKFGFKPSEELKKVQHEILDRYSRMVKPKGKLVYSTCSIFPSENQNQIQTFLKNHPEFELEDEMILPPSPGDGFYAARLSRN